MSKIIKDFEFEKPVTLKRIGTSLNIEFLCVGNLMIKGVGTFCPNVSALEEGRYEAEITEVIWSPSVHETTRPVNILPLLEALDKLDDLYDAAVQHVSGLFEQDTTPAIDKVV